MEVKKKASNSSRGRPVKTEGKLEKGSIIRTARKLTLSGGKAPSIRKLASELMVDPMAIYHYFPNKHSLLEGVTHSIIEELYEPHSGLTWKENLLELCRSYITLLLRYPDLVSIILSSSGKSASQVFMERFEACVSELELSPDRIRTITDLLADYIHGFAFAAACNTTEATVAAEMAEGPLNFIIEGMETL